jgi:site-specific DNA-methyltransferase (adenine-specific)
MENAKQPEIVIKQITEISPYEKNPRRNDEAVKYVAASIEKFGFKQPIVIDRDGIIVAGHTRYKAAKKLNLKAVPCIVADDLTDEQIKAYRLADNKVAEKSEWDFDLLSTELDALFDFDMTVFGFEDDDQPEEEPEVYEDDFEMEPPEEPKAKRGDIYKLGNHRLMCGDSTNITDVERLMGGEKASMGFTDPPWNVNYGAVKDGNAQGYKPRTILNDFMGTEDFKQFMSDAFASLNFAMKDGAMTYVVMSAQEWGNMMLTLAQNNYHWSSTIIWNKDSLVLSRKDYHTKYEPIWYGWKEGTRLCPLEDRKQSDVWDIPRPKKSEEHPTMKPIELVARAITNSSKKGDVVIDLFGGSGTTLIASEQTERCCRMMELDPKYVDVIVNRWEQFTGEKAELIKGDKR